MPHLGEGLTSASAKLQTYYGELSSGWKLTNGALALDVVIPANTTANIYIPAAGAEAVTEGGTALSSVKDIQVTATESGYVMLKAGSGKYHFEVKK
jgi:alpha-L-rhamnosidase